MLSIFGCVCVCSLYISCLENGQQLSFELDDESGPPFIVIWCSVLDKEENTAQSCHFICAYYQEPAAHLWRRRRYARDNTSSTANNQWLNYGVTWQHIASDQNERRDDCRQRILILDPTPYADGASVLLLHFFFLLSPSTTKQQLGISQTPSTFHEIPVKCSSCPTSLNFNDKFWRLSSKNSLLTRRGSKKKTKKTKNAEEEQAPPADLREFNSTKRNI